MSNLEHKCEDRSSIYPPRDLLLLPSLLVVRPVPVDCRPPSVAAVLSNHVEGALGDAVSLHGLGVHARVEHCPQLQNTYRFTLRILRGDNFYNIKLRKRI